MYVLIKHILYQIKNVSLKYILFPFYFQHHRIAGYGVTELSVYPFTGCYLPPDNPRSGFSPYAWIHPVAGN